MFALIKAEDFSNSYWVLIEMMEPDSSQGCTVKRQEATDTGCSEGNFSCLQGNIFHNADS